MPSRRWRGPSSVSRFRSRRRRRSGTASLRWSPGDPVAHRSGSGRLRSIRWRMRGAGLSARKVEYLTRPGAPLRRRRGACGQWTQMDDDAIIDELVAIRGIGRWTAEMFLIFHLMRPNVMPLDDVGPDQGHQHQLLQRRAGIARRSARSGRGLGAIPLGRHLVHLAQPRSAAGRLLTRTAAAGRHSPTTRIPSMSKRHFLDFEQRVAELETKIEELRYVQNESAVDISEEIDRLSKKSLQLTKDVYSKLSPWQVTQIARHPQRPYTLDYVNEVVHRVPGTARRPALRRRPVDRRRHGALQRPGLHGDRPPEGPRHQGARRCATSACRGRRVIARPCG